MNPRPNRHCCTALLVWSRSVALAVAALSLFAICSATLADTVHLTNGRTLDGRAVVEDNGDVALYSSMGVIRLPKDKVARIDRKDSVEDQILARLDQLQSPTADDLYELGFEANRRGASTLARDLFSEALRLNPEHDASKRALGIAPTFPTPASRQVRGGDQDQLAAEQLKLLRALRAQADAARIAELRRQQLLAAQLEAEAQRQAYTPRHRPQVLYPVSAVGQVFAPPAGVAIKRERSRPSVAPPRSAVRNGSAAAPPRPQRRKRIVTVPRP